MYLRFKVNINVMVCCEADANLVSVYVE